MIDRLARHALPVLVSCAAGAFGCFGVYELAYGTRVGPNAVLASLAFVVCALLLANLIWIRVALTFMRVSDEWRALAYARKPGPNPFPPADPDSSPSAQRGAAAFTPPQRHARSPAAPPDDASRTEATP